MGTTHAFGPRGRERERFQGRKLLAEEVDAADHIEAGRLGRLHLPADFLGSGCPDLVAEAEGSHPTDAIWRGA